MAKRRTKAEIWDLIVLEDRHAVWVAKMMYQALDALERRQPEALKRRLNYLFCSFDIKAAQLRKGRREAGEPAADTTKTTSYRDDFIDRLVATLCDGDDAFNPLQLSFNADKFKALPADQQALALEAVKERWLEMAVIMRGDLTEAETEAAELEALRAMWGDDEAVQA